MAKIEVKNMTSKTIHIADKRESLLNILLSNTDWMHACGGRGRCVTCRCAIVEGGEHLSEETQNERRFRNLNKLLPNERLACQCTTDGDVVIKVPDPCKLPHLEYID